MMLLGTEPIRAQNPIVGGVGISSFRGRSVTTGGMNEIKMGSGASLSMGPKDARRLRVTEVWYPTAHRPRCTETREGFDE